MQNKKISQAKLIPPNAQIHESKKNIQSTVVI